MVAETISTLTVEETVEILRSAGMRIATESLRDGIEQKQFPFAICIKRGRGHNRMFEVFPAPLDEWLRWAFRKSLLDVAPGHIAQRITEMPEKLLDETNEKEKCK